MSDEIVVIGPKNLEECKALSQDLSVSSLLPQALRKRPEDILAIVLTGAELGLAPMQAIRGIHIINGKASLSAELMGGLVKRSPTCEYLKLTKTSGTVATYVTKRKGEPETAMNFTIEQAKAAGLSGDNWRKYPDAMLRARCLSAICKAVYPDLCLGLYDSDSGELTEGEPTSPQAEHVSQIKTQIQAQVKGEVVDGEIVSPSTMEARIKAAPSLGALTSLVAEIRLLSADVRSQLAPTYSTRKAELEGKAV